MNEFNSQVCTSIEQSKRLLELGLKPETADCYNREEEFGFSNWIGKPSLHSDIPAWSLHRLLEMYVERYISCNVNLKELTFDWLIDEIEIHITENDFNKEYLKQ